MVDLYDQFGCISTVNSSEAHLLNKNKKIGQFNQLIHLYMWIKIRKLLYYYKKITTFFCFLQSLSINDRLTDFLTKNDLIVTTQFGFRKGKSTIHAAVKILVIEIHTKWEIHL